MTYIYYIYLIINKKEYLSICMLSPFTKLKLLITIFLCILFGSTVKAQFSPPMTIQTPFGSGTIPGHGMMNFHYHFYGKKIPANGKYDYTIVLLNDSTISTKTILNIDFAKNHTSISWEEGKGKERKTHSVSPRETKEIYRMVLGEYKLTGIPLDSTWAFLVDKGKIRTYSVTSDFREPTIAYFQYGIKGAILPLTKDNLRPLIEEDPEVVKLVDKNKLVRAIKRYNEKLAKAALHSKTPTC